MKLVPGPLPPVPTGATMDRFPISIPFPSDLIWRYPIGLPPFTPTTPTPPPLMEYKSQLPSNLATDPRIWSREDVCTFLRWAEKEYDLQPIDMEKFQMNGKAMCLLNRSDLAERAPGSGDVIYNVLQILIRDVTNFLKCLPSSPVTPTSRTYPVSPHSHPPTPTWNILNQNNEGFHSHAATIAHLMSQGNSVTLSPAPSIDSQAGSPQYTEATTTTYGHSIFASSSGSNGSGSNQSDSDEDSFVDVKNGPHSSPPNTPTVYLAPPLPHNAPRSPKETISPSYKREFFPDAPTEPNTNGRLLWDFLQQLLNDPAQRYTSYIAWKNRETGVFKIVDPPGLAKLWGIQKNHLSMNYDKMSRALRYYYRVNILRKVQGERHSYQFLRNPSELKNIKNLSLLRQQMSPTRPQTTMTAVPQYSVSVKTEPESEQETHFRTHESDDKPTDLSMDVRTDASSNMDVPTDLSSSSSRHVNIICSPDTPTFKDHPHHFYKKEEDSC